MLDDKEQEINRLSHWLDDIVHLERWADPLSTRIWVISYNRKDQAFTIYSDFQDCLNNHVPEMMGYTTVKVVGSNHLKLMKYESRYYGYLPKFRMISGEPNPGILFNYWIYGYVNPYLNIFSSPRKEDLGKLMQQNHPLGGPEGYTLVKFKITETGKTWKGRQHDDRI